MNRAWTWALAAAFLAGGCEGLDGNSIFPGFSKPSPGADEDGYTIWLAIFTDPDHVFPANDYKKNVEDLTHWRNLFVLHEENKSTVCWGRYATIEEAGKDLPTAKNWTSPSRAHPFANAQIAPRRGEDIGPPEWNLSRATGYYTVVIARFYNLPDQKVFGRKTYAVETCRQLRSQGEEAYYYHGDVVSLVTVGSFPKEAYQTVEKDGVARAVVADAGLMQVFDKHPRLAQNGYEQIVNTTDPRTGQPERRAAVTYVDIIPSSKNRSGAGDRPARPDHRPAGYPQPR